MQQFGQTVADVKTATMDYFGKADKEAKEKAQTEYEQAQAAYQANPTAENKTKEDVAKAVYNIAKEQAQKWEVGGEYRRNVDMATNVLTVALSGGTPAEMLASGASPIINNKIKELTKDNKVANIMAHAAWGAIEATAAKGNASAGVVAATSAEIVAPMLAETLYGTSDPEKLSNEQRKTIVDLSSAVAGITSGLVSSTGNSVEISQAVKKGAEIGETSVQYNYLSDWQEKSRENAKKQCGQDYLCIIKNEVYWEAIDKEQNASFAVGVVAGVPVSLKEFVEGISQLSLHPIDSFNAIRELIENGQLVDTVKQSYLERIDYLQSEYEKAGAKGSFNAGVETGKFFFEVITTVGTGGATGAVKKVGDAGKIVSKLASKVKKLRLPNAINATDELGNASSIPNVTNVISNATVGIKWGDGILNQGKPWENYLEKILGDGAINLNMNTSNFKTFDFLLIDNKAISAKIMDLLRSKTYQNPNRITSQLNKYVDGMINFESDGKKR